MGIWNKFKSYLLLKKDKEFADNQNMKFMHGMNKISIFIFLIALVVIVTKCVS